jgi:hypothetical protein
MKRWIFYAIVAIASYFAGILAYLSYLSLVYDEGIGSEWFKFLAWTLPPYVVLFLPIYALLHRSHRVSIWFRTSLLIMTIVIAAMSVPIMMGLGFQLWPLHDLFSPELGLFYLLFASSALTFSVGILVTRKGRGYLVFILGSILLIGLTIRILAIEAESSRPVIHRIPQHFHGTVIIHYGDPGNPPIPKEDGYYVIHIPNNGVYRTSSLRPTRGIRHMLVDEQGLEVQELQINRESGSVGAIPGVMISEYVVP